MSKPGLILIGAGGHAQACIDVIELHNQYQIAGLVGMQAELHSKILGYPVMATDDDLPQLVKEYRYAMIGLGQINSPEGRIRLYQRAIQLGFQLPSIISPIAHVSPNATLGDASIVMHGAIVNAAARVGSNCIINSRALLEHGCIVNDHCHIATGAIVNGDVVVGAGSFIGSGSVLKEGIHVGQYCLVGMGLALRHNLKDQTCFIGNKTA